MKNAPADSQVPFANRVEHSLSTSRVQWWQGYQGTAGLDAFRDNERYAVWSHAHRKLMQDNPLYAADTRWFWTCCLFSAMLAISLWTILELLAPAFTFALASGVLLCYREQRRRNAAIAEQLKLPA